jgi:tetratricopeptide (TPR) repeat protein
MNDWLFERFPEMQPISGPPSLSTVNGIGAMVYGNRDHDEESGTYVKTLCFCVLFIPLFFLRAYRVADAQRGWYFLGRVPLSGLARGWNYLMVTALISGPLLGWWIYHTHTDEYRAGQQIAAADRLVTEGKLEAAARQYREVALGHTSHVAAAQAKLGELIDSSAARENADAAALALPIIVDVHQSGRTIDRLFERTVALAKTHADKNPRAALKLVDAVDDLVPDSPELIAFRLPLLQGLYEKDPTDPDVTSGLALIHEARGQHDECEKLLGPHAAKLGDREGARILGQIYARQGHIEKAYPLLEAYIDKRLQSWQKAEESMLATFKQLDYEIIDELKKKKARDFDYVGYQALPKAAQDEMVQQYINKRLKDHPAVRKAVEQQRAQGKVVPVVLDFGIVLLRRGQALPDPEARHQELQRAEKMFLTIRQQAGQTTTYRLFLGQVYYWLGKHAEGRKQFDDLLTDQKHQTESMLAVADTLREVGAVSEARAMAEDAYTKATDPKWKHDAAATRALMALDQEDQIQWLERGNPSDPVVKASLRKARGDKALEQGKTEEAVVHYRAAADIYAGMPESSFSLNNSALVHQALYGATGDPQALEKSIAQLEKALSLKPGDSILLRNTAGMIMANALGDIAGKEIDLRVLKTSGSLGMISFLYRDAAGQARYRERVRAHKVVARAMAHYERLRVLAPKDPRVYSILARHYAFTHDQDKLRELSKAAQEASLDLADANRLTLEQLQGKRDDRLRKELHGSRLHFRDALAAARKLGGATLALAVEGQVNLEAAGEWLGIACDHDAVVALAEEADKTAPSRGTKRVLRGALLARAHDTLLKKEPAYARLCAPCLRTMHAITLLAIALTPDSPTCQACLANPDVRRALQMTLDQAQLFPEDADEWTWAMLRSAHPKEAAGLAKQVLQSERLRLERAIALKTNPLSAHDAYREHWARLLAGEQAQARAVLDELRTKGVALPTEGK